MRCTKYRERQVFHLNCNAEVCVPCDMIRIVFTIFDMEFLSNFGFKYSIQPSSRKKNGLRKSKHKKT